MAEEKVSELLANISRSIASLRYHVDTLGPRNYADQRLYISREIERIADAFAAISASPSPPKADGPGEVSVKALEWKQHGDRYAYKSSFYREWSADPDIDIRYVVRYVEHNPEARPGYFVPPFDPHYSDGKSGERYATLEAAQAVHQADYEARILSALVSPSIKREA